VAAIVLSLRSEIPRYKLNALFTSQIV